MTFIDHMTVTYYGIYSTVIGYKRGPQIVNYYFLKENLNTLYMEKLSYSLYFVQLLLCALLKQTSRYN